MNQRKSASTGTPGNDYEPTIGLEIHVQLKTRTKMFCSCPNDPDEKHPNVNICPICLGHPGTLPTLNRKAVEEVLKVGLALGGTIPEITKWDRKNYFYPDLPKGYQISQYDEPLVSGGSLTIPSTGEKVDIRRIHLEEDAGRLVHTEDPRSNVKGQMSDVSLVDFNRAGIPLMELVTEPDMHSGRDAREFAEELQRILRYLDVSDADMEKGQMRVEVNMSLAQMKGVEIELGTKVEIKNLNSLRSVERAIDYEIRRQSEILEKKEKVVQETRGWDEIKGVTFSQREKEEAQDYRYFPEPDLSALELRGPQAQINLEALETELPELPHQKRDRFKKEFGLADKDITILVDERAFAEFFEEAASELSEHAKINDYQILTNYLVSDLRGLLEKSGAAINELKFTPEQFAELIAMISQQELSSRVAKIVLEEMFETGDDPEAIVGRRGLKQVHDQAALSTIVEAVVGEEKKAVEDFKKGKAEALQFLVGKAMAKAKGAANPEILRNLFRERLEIRD